MAPNPNSNQRPEATPPQPKKRKLATKGALPAKRAIARPPFPPSEDTAPKRDSIQPISGRSNASLSSSPASKSSASALVSAGPRRMVASPARPRVGAQAPVQAVLPVGENRRFSVTKSAPPSSRQKPHSPLANMSARDVAGAGARMTPRARARHGVYVRTPRTGEFALRRIETDLLATGSEWTDVDSDSDEYESSRPLTVIVPVREPPQGLHRARKTFTQVAAKTAKRDAPMPARRVREAVIYPGNEDEELEMRPEDDDNEGMRLEDDENDGLYVDADPDWLIQHAQAAGDGGVGAHDIPEDLGPALAQPEDPEEELMAALDALSLRGAALHAEGRLPFLRRNVRRSLDVLGAQKARARASEGAAPPRVRVEYVVGLRRFGDYSVHGWRCPLCRVLRTMPFATRAGLELHLARYHKRCEFSLSDGDAEGSPLLRIKIPEVPESDSESDTDLEDQLSSSDSEDAQAAPPVLSDGFPALQRSPTPEQKPFLRGSSVIGGRNVFLSSPTKPPRSPSPTPSSARSTRVPIARPSPAVPADVPRPRRPIDPENPARYPTPPPLADLEGPAAVFPYIDIAGGAYSARPGGPRLYDLLSELPLTPFGLITWYVLDKEEDIFELDNVRDEDKVMRALWGRWIVLNRNAFVADYAKGARMFIDEYWRMIHRAAGFAALRIWLLTLAHNRFLTGEQLCDLLKYYSDLVGMDLWK